LSLLILAVVVSAYGQAMMTARATIPFAFMVGKQVLPQGQYEFRKTSTPAAINVKNVDKGTSAYAPIITRLAGGIHTTPKDAHIVFDKVGDVYTLSEIWEPGQDGYLLHSTKGEHEHQIIDVPK
jgi:hypothetical protein